jgi:hypothetical protein
MRFHFGIQRLESTLAVEWEWAQVLGVGKALGWEWAQVLG